MHELNKFGEGKGLFSLHGKSHIEMHFKRKKNQTAAAWVFEYNNVFEQDRI